MNEPDSLTEFYDGRYAEGYMEDWPESKKRRVGDLLRRLGLPERGRALDFGCGQGVFTRVIRDALPGWEVFGTELSEVALRMASHRVPDCRFLTSDELERLAPFDFIFTHHVLEHVRDIDATLADMSRVASPASAMLHILPCGNEGSFEHRLATWHADGIQSGAQNRFFFEDAGHLRRLTSRDLVAAAERQGWQIRSQRFANQFWGAIDWITDLDFAFIGTLTDTDDARHAGARVKLLGWRLALTAVRLARRVPGSPLNRLLKRRAKDEWDRRQTEVQGSEMYLLFQRGEG